MNPSGGREIAKRFGIPGYTDSVEELLGDPAIDAVYIASPVDAHFEQIKKAAMAGKHILCEKPLAIGAERARAAVAICREKDVKLQVGYMMRFHGAHRKIKEFIDAGALGTVVAVRAQLSCWYPPLPGAWRQDPARGGGGALIDLGSHLFDLLEFFLGKISAIGTMTGSLVHDYRSEDSSVALIRFECGAFATISCFFNIPDQASPSRLEVYGSRGSLVACGTLGQDPGGALEGVFAAEGVAYDALQRREGRAPAREIPFEHVDPYRAEAEYFSRCVLTDAPVDINSGENAVRICEIVEKAYRSSREKAFLSL